MKTIEEQIIKLRSEGKPIRVIMEATGQKEWFVRKVCNNSQYKGLKSNGRVLVSDDMILAKYQDGKTYREIAKELGVSDSRVGILFRKNGYKKPLTRKQLEVKKLREQGYCSIEISRMLGVPVKTIKSIAKTIKMPFNDEEIEKSISLGRNKSVEINKKTEREITTFINENYPDFEYAGGYSGSEGTLNIRCKKCGAVFSRSMITLRHHNNIKCPECIKAERQKKNEQMAILSKQKAKTIAKAKQEKEESKFWSQQFKQVKFKVCPVCGAFFVGKNKYCSDICARYVSNGRKDKRFGSRKTNKSITAKALYKRDNGICWICGNECNLNDYVKIQDRTGKETIVCGNSYPSVDHIVPVCEGGEDSWDNVRLACRYCNSKRYWEAQNEK